MSEFAVRFRKNWRDFKRLQPKLEVVMFMDSGWFLVLLGVWIPLPFLDRFVGGGCNDFGMRSWGVSYGDRSLYLQWDKWTKFVYMPWSFEHVKWEVMRPDGTWVPKVNSWDGKEPDGRWETTYPYRYILRSGEVQERTATIYVERGYWHWLFAKWLRLPLWLPVVNITKQSIDIRFNDEVGERTGSWKGGCIGTGYTMLKGETPEQTLRRMERERKF